jgi:hypothetical protein
MKCYAMRPVFINGPTVTIDPAHKLLKIRMDFVWVDGAIGQPTRFGVKGRRFETHVKYFFVFFCFLARYNHSCSGAQTP